MLASVIGAFLLSILIGIRTGKASALSYFLIFVITVVEVGIILYEVFTIEQPAAW